MDDNGQSSLLSSLSKIKLIAALVSPFGLTVFFSVFFIILISSAVAGKDMSGESSSDFCYTVKSVAETCSSITVKGSSTISVDEYVGGVVSHEFGGAAEYPEMLKAQAIAARSYALAQITPDGDGVCVINDTSQGFQTFDANPGEVYLQAAKDTSGMVMVDENGNIAVTEYSANSLPNAYNTYKGDTITMSERDLEIPKEWFDSNKTCTDSALNTIDGQKDWDNRDVYGNGHGRGMGQIAAFYLVKEKNYTYEQVLDYFYGQDSVYKLSLASTNGSSNKICFGSSVQTIDHYTENHEGLNVLDRVLTSEEIRDLEAELEEDIKRAGHGSGAAVAAAGQRLIYWLEKKGYYLDYRWGGGHDYPTNNGCDLHGTFYGANPNWGSDKCGADEKSGSVHYGMDCSGFVSWATRMGCDKDFGNFSSGSWQTFGDGPIDILDTEPGDVLADDGHVALVVKNNGTDIYIAEENGGLIFRKISSSNHPAYSMRKWYANNCTDIRPGTGGGTSSGKGKILLVAGHSFEPYCGLATNECRGYSNAGYAEEVETRDLIKRVREALISQGFSNDDIDVANELLGEDFNDKNTSKSLYVELVNKTEAFKKINFGQYKFALEIHFNGSTDGTASGVCTVCTSGNCGIASGINSSIRRVVSSTLGNGNNGVCNVSTHTFNYFTELGIPYTYLETEFYDNASAMKNYTKKKDDVAAAIAKVIWENYK